MGNSFSALLSLLATTYHVNPLAGVETDMFVFVYVPVLMPMLMSALVLVTRRRHGCVLLRNESRTANSGVRLGRGFVESLPNSKS